MPNQDAQLESADSGVIDCLEEMLEQAKSGDVPAIRLFLQWRGEMIERKEVDHKQPIRFIVGEQWLTGDEADAGEFSPPGESGGSLSRT